MLVMEILNHRKAWGSFGSELFSHNLLYLPGNSLKFEGWFTGWLRIHVCTGDLKLTVSNVNWDNLF